MEKKYSAAFILSLVSFIMILLNGIWILTNDAPIILSSFNASSAEEVMNAKAFWGRISFGIPGLVEGYWTLFWLIFAAATLVCGILVYKDPRKYRTNGLLMMVCSFLSLPIGGGFYIGAILGFISGAASIEWSKSFKETFFGKIIRAATGNSKFYTMIRDNSETIGIAAFTVIFVSVLSGIGNGLYTYNLDLIKKGGDAASAILLQGCVMMWNENPFITATSLIGMGVVKWLILSLTIYWIGARLTAIPVNYEKVVRITAFVYVPEILQVFMPFMFSNEPTLSYNWPLGLYAISRLWVFIILVVAITQTFDFPKGRAFGVAIFGGALYWPIYHMIVIPTLNVPGVEVQLAMPQSSWVILIGITVVAIIAMLLGVFRKK